MLATRIFDRTGRLVAASQPELSLQRYPASSWLSHPDRNATAIEHVWVKGQQVVRDGKHTGAKPGRFVKGPEAAWLERWTPPADRSGALSFLSFRTNVRNLPV